MSSNLFVGVGVLLFSPSSRSPPSHTHTLFAAGCAGACGSLHSHLLNLCPLIRNKLERFPKVRVEGY